MKGVLLTTLGKSTPDRLTGAGFGFMGAFIGAFLARQAWLYAGLAPVPEAVGIRLTAGLVCVCYMAGLAFGPPSDFFDSRGSRLVVLCFGALVTGLLAVGVAVEVVLWAVGR